MTSFKGYFKLLTNIFNSWQDIQFSENSIKHFHQELLKMGYLYMPYVSHEKLIEDKKLDYYLALRHSQKTFKLQPENIIPWLDFFLTTLLLQSQVAKDLLTGENIEILLSPKQLAVWNYLQKIKDASPKQIAKNAHIPRPTVNQVLNKLIRLNKVERIGEGSSTRYRIIH